jgi:hypothetical protein
VAAIDAALDALATPAQIEPPEPGGDPGRSRHPARAPRRHPISSRRSYERHTQPAAAQLLDLIAREEPNARRADENLAEVSDDELAPGLREWAGALEHAAAKLVRHDAASSELVAPRLERIACLLTQAAENADSARPAIRGQLRPFHWRQPDTPPPGDTEPGAGDQPTPTAGEPQAATEGESEQQPPGCKTGGEPPPEQAAQDAAAPEDGADEPATGGTAPTAEPGGDREPPDRGAGAGPCAPEGPA